MPATPTLIRHPGGFLVCDAVLDASIVAEAEFTEHAIESGSPVTDHAIRKPFTIALTLVATDTPISATVLSPAGDLLSQTGVQRQSVSAPMRTFDAPGRLTTELNVRKSLGQQLNVSGAVGAALDFLKNAAGPSAIEGRAAPGLTQRTLDVAVLTSDSPVDRIHAFYTELLGLLTAATPVDVIFKGRTYSGYVFTSLTKSDAGGQWGRSTFPVQLKQLLTVETRQVSLPAVPKQKSKKDLGAKPPVPPTPEAEAARRKTVAAAVLDLALQ